MRSASETRFSKSGFFMVIFNCAVRLVGLRQSLNRHFDKNPLSKAPITGKSPGRVLFSVGCDKGSFMFVVHHSGGSNAIISRGAGGSADHCLGVCAALYSKKVERSSHLQHERL